MRFTLRVFLTQALFAAAVVTEHVVAAVFRAEAYQKKSDRQSVATVTNTVKASVFGKKNNEQDY